MSNNLYQDLYRAVKQLHEGESGQFSQKKANEIWGRLKGEAKTADELHNLTSAKIKNIKEEISKKRAKFTSFFLKVSTFKNKSFYVCTIFFA